jgi:hypothetical protein
MTTLKRTLAALFGIAMDATLHHHYVIEARDKEGRLKWREELDNLVTTVGKNKYLDATLKTGLASPAWYVSLIKAASGSIDVADTLASHSGWTEGAYSTDWTGNRIAFTAGTIAAGSVDNSGAKAVFPILGTLTIKGALLADASTGTSGTLLGAALFTGGDRSVVAGDTLSVTVTCSLT